MGRTGGGHCSRTTCCGSFALLAAAVAGARYCRCRCSTGTNPRFKNICSGEAPATTAACKGEGKAVLLESQVGAAAGCTLKFAVTWEQTTCSGEAPAGGDQEWPQTLVSQLNDRSAGTGGHKLCRQVSCG